MNNKGLETQIRDEIMDMVHSRKSLMLSSLDENGLPYASYAPFAVGDDCLYVLISEIAVHGKNLQLNPQASALIIEDEDTANELFARLRVFYRVRAEMIEPETTDWQQGIDSLQSRHGERINNLSKLSDFKLFRLHPNGGRYVKGFGKAYQIEGGTLSGDSLSHLREGHKKRSNVSA
ncbi:HugZ family protein [Methylophaga sp. OBS1]|uniref:HugZ family pyridoxamine 5'-phosphate oxidase n=1 Tax=Methylophaga sp. OBS1 TaxID=2991933 RepID=UPI00225889AD|nr:pyridoxamine 5'-phosphate oxidase family protein [Methylophaga sp. OBS1]MCX4192672.1 pyridoxamine 5'-phosphate oxidase family protein [Methylophaga sp. OBS1]